MTVRLSTPYPENHNAQQRDRRTYVSIMPILRDQYDRLKILNSLYFYT